ncbi:MAG: phosphoribosylformylglycinamidine synthase [Oscillospiraceae bacterium]|nr:phosphoribosylformylglycinamidine synthase [Oscillospiraceae bacterium]
MRRIFVEKREGFDVEAKALFADLSNNLQVNRLSGVRIINRYDVDGMNEAEFSNASTTIFSEPQVDKVYDEEIDLGDSRYFITEYLPGQYDQRADTAEQCAQMLVKEGARPNVKSAKVIVLRGTISDADFKRISEYCVNPVESRIAGKDKPLTLLDEINQPDNVAVLDGFISLNEAGLREFIENYGLAMDFEDIKFCQAYFNSENRNPTITEIRMIDTYWSDHCRHTTFLTSLDNVEIEDEFIKSVYDEYLATRRAVYKDREKPICLMDIATIAMKELRSQGKLENFDISEEVNACSIVVDVDVDGENREYLVMFKNETHNHPTEIEPFGGAATCLGGAIRDPLSGRAYVYQAMRVTGSGDPRATLAETMKGKLSQRKITTGAAAGYSSYGNQIGLATGQVAEIYDEGYIAKRMEIGAVIAAAPKENVVRHEPSAGDKIILLGGKTGRDGCGGATGSSKAHTDDSLAECGAEVQKGNAPEERKIQRLFRKKEVTTLIKRCNDFGAGGVSVAIGELADGLVIDLDCVPKKYEGLDGTELAISESQERMAVVVEEKDVAQFIKYAEVENLEANVVATVTDEARLTMKWRGDMIADISREFLNTNGSPKSSAARITKPEFGTENLRYAAVGATVKEKIINQMGDLNIACQKGLVERFDSTVGANSVFLPFGGKEQLTPQQNMVAKVPVMSGKTDTATVMSYGYNPKISKTSPFAGAVYAVVDAVTKAVIAGSDYSEIYLTLQEYFERLGTDSTRWGKPLAALLGAHHAQKELGIAAIGGKDSMSGSFNDIDVPPTLVAFAVGTVNASKAVSCEFKEAGNPVVLLAPRYENGLPNFDSLKDIYKQVNSLIADGAVKSAYAIGYGGISEAICKMSFGNKIGFAFSNNFEENKLYTALYGGILLEISNGAPLVGERVGRTTDDGLITIGGEKIELDEIINAWKAPLNGVFPMTTANDADKVKNFSYGERVNIIPKTKFAAPKVFIPAFPGTNCEYETARAFERAGAIAHTEVFRNVKPEYIAQSIESFTKAIKESQILMIPGGFSGGDEPDGSGKFIATVFRNPQIREATMDLLQNRDGLILGICNGFQALIKLGLVPFGEIRDMDADCPTLTFNTIGRHISQMTNTRIASVKSPWLAGCEVGDIHTISMSHGEGRFVASDEMIAELEKTGQIATQYVDCSGNASLLMPYNPNGSYYAVEGITSPDGRVFGKMGHSERMGENVAKNVPGNKNQQIFESGVKYFG